MKKHQLALSVALGSLMTSTAMAQKVDLSEVNVDAYGHINMAIMHGDTGNGSEQYIVDNKYASSRVGTRITTDLEDLGMTVGAHVEFEYQHNSSHAVTPEDRSVDGDWEKRHINLFAKGRYGMISAGQGSGAGDGATEMDLSGTKVASFPDLALVGGALPFVEKNGDGEAKVISSVRSQDFEGRYDRIRYDSPNFGPLKVAVSHGYKEQGGGNADTSELAVRYDGAIDGLGRISAAVGYAAQYNESGGAVARDTVGGSVSWLHDSGFNATGLYTYRDFDNGREETSFNMVKLGYKTGKHSFTVHRAQGQDFNPILKDDQGTNVYTAAGSDVEIYGAAYVYQPVKRLDVYAAFNNFALDADQGDYDDVNVAMVGSRLKF
ncbi:MAG: porin [Alteromonadaceae bacterium]|nr:porin [Alteromonadaceae bacterium]